MVNTWSGGPGATPQTQYGFSAGAGLLLTANTLSIGTGTVLEFYVDDTDPYQGDNDGGWGDGTFASVTGASPLSHGSLAAQGGTIVTGDGVFRKTGPGVLAFETYNSSVSFQMTGGTIDIEDGLLRNGAWGGPDWTNNKASMNLGPSGWFDMWRGNPVIVDALTGSGQFNDDDGYGTNNYLTIGVNNGSGTWSGTISDQSNTIFVTKTGSGTEIFAGANVYHGTTTISGGVLELADANAVENSTVVVNVNNSLALATSDTYNVGGLTGSGNLSLTAVDGSAATLSVGGNEQSTTYSGVLAGLGSLIKAGTSTLVLAGTDTYTGGTTVSGGTLQIGNASALGSTSGAAAVSSGATLDLHGYSVGLGALAGAGTIDNLSGSSTYTLTVGNGNAGGTFSGTIADTTGTIALTKTGTGTQVLAGSNTYTGATTINGGNLAVNGSLSPSGSITVNSPGALSGAGTVGSVIVNSRGTVAPGFSLGGGTLTAGSLSLSPSSVLSYTLATSSASSSNSRLSITGGLTLSTGLTLSITPAPGSTWTSATSGTYVLATYGSLTNNSSSFSGWTVGANPLLGRHTYGFSVGSGSLDLTVGSAAGVSGTWSGSGGGSWGTAGDWQGGNIPGYVGDTATFGMAIGSPRRP